MLNFNITVAADVDNQYLLDVNVYNVANEPIVLKKEIDWNGPTKKVKYTASLPMGIYILRAGILNNIKDTTIILDKDLAYSLENYDPNYPPRDPYIIKLPPIASSILFDKTKLNNYELSHEYYTGNAEKYSMQNTMSQTVLHREKQVNSLFVFLRFGSDTRFQEIKNEITGSFFDKFSIIDDR